MNPYDEQNPYLPTEPSPNGPPPPYNCPVPPGNYDLAVSNTNMFYQEVQYGRGAHFVNNNNDISLVQFAIKAGVENERLKNELAKTEASCAAFQTVIKNGDGRTYVPDKNGKFVELMGFHITHVRHFFRPGEKEAASFYAIWTNQNNTSPLILNEKDYFDDKKLVQELQEYTHKAIYLRNTQRSSAILIRQVAATVCEEVPVLRFAGWMKMEGKTTFLQFLTEGIFSTHQGENGLALPQHLDTAGRTPEIQANAADCFCRSFMAVNSDLARPILFFWAHAGAIASLLPEMGCHSPGALYLYCPSPHALEMTKTLFQSFQDAPLNLSQPSDTFSQALWERKDEATLIYDRRDTKYAAQNTSTLQSAISTNAFELSGHGTVSLQSTPVILSTTVTDLAAFPACLTIDLSPEEIKWPEVDGEDTSQAVDPFSGYRLDFISFTEANISLLRQDIHRGMQWAATEVAEELSQQAAETLGTLYGVMTFVRRFYHSMNQDALFDSVIPANFLKEIPAPFVELSAKADLGTDIVETFLSVLRLHIARLKRVFPRSEFRLAFPPKEARVLFYDEADLFLSSAKVTELCRAMRFSRTVVLAALAEAGVLSGKRVNNTTYLTRVTVKRFDGSSVSLPVLKIPLSALETFGELSILGGKEG